MARKSKEQWFALFQEHEESGLKASEFCRLRQICSRYFSKRKKDLGWRSTDKINHSEDRPLRLVKVQGLSASESADAASMRLVSGKACLTIPLKQSPSWVAQLIKAVNE